MDRSNFIKSMALLPFATTALNLSDLSKMAESLTSSEKMPVLFLGHGSPMNAIEENEFVTGFRTIAKEIPRPKAILCVSAHWETRGTFVTAMPMPKTIHDFGGFPPELFAVRYPAPGKPELAKEVAATIKKTEVGLDQSWGLDHGCWSVVKHLYPNADIPVLELSLDYTQPAQYHYDLAKELSALRSKGVLIIGSGNMVHNLGMVSWDKLNAIGYGFDWAMEASNTMKKYILNGDHQPLINYRSQGKSFDLAIPSPDHYLPLLYTLALKDDMDDIKLFNDKPVAGALTMTSVKIG
jgi:4,5-DOPA dioxygenase extradiol